MKNLTPEMIEKAKAAKNAEELFAFANLFVCKQPYFAILNLILTNTARVVLVVRAQKHAPCE